jgi:hypothetical protein
MEVFFFWKYFSFGSIFLLEVFFFWKYFSFGLGSYDCIGFRRSVEDWEDRGILKIISSLKGTVSFIRALILREKQKKVKPA